MSISSLLLGIWLILVGADWLNWISVSKTVLGLLAFILGIVILVDTVHPLTTK